MAAIDKGSRRGKTPAERGEEARDAQRQLKEEAAERRKKALTGAADPGPKRPKRPMRP
jgi:hypothetical protein